MIKKDCRVRNAHPRKVRIFHINDLIGFFFNTRKDDTFLNNAKEKKGKKKGKRVENFKQKPMDLSSIDQRSSSLLNVRRRF